MGGWRIAAVLLAAVPASAHALEYRSIASDRVVMYDAPSLHAKKLYLASRHYPVEVIVSLESFAKVRDAAGDLAWVEKKNLSEKRMVRVNVSVAEIYQAPDGKAPAFRAERGVVLELLEPASAGWLKVRHQDGATGFVRSSQVWGS